MAAYQIEWKRSAIKELNQLPKEAINRIVEHVSALAENPFPNGVRKLIGTDEIYRIRIGEYRVIYQVFAQKLVIIIIRVRHRKDVYR